MKDMKNPWTQKNPFLSMWLSGANAVWGATGARARAEMHRQAARLVSEGTRQMIQFWSVGLSARTPRRKKKTR
jgi:hypothetical protein